MSEFKITDADIRGSLSTSDAFSAGLEYFRDGRTRILNVDDDDQSLEIDAETQGGGSARYTQVIEVLRRKTGVLEIDGSCTCPVASNCKHVASALLKWRAMDESGSLRGVPPQVGAWLDRVEAVATRSVETFPPELRQRMFYILLASPDGGGAVVKPVSARLDKAGAIAESGKTYDASNARSASPAKFLRASDLAILTRLEVRRIYAAGQDGYALTGYDGGDILRAILATGRALWENIKGPTLSAGPDLNGRAAWRVGQDGAQSFTLELEGAPNAFILALAPPQYVDLAGTRLGRVVADLPDALAAALLSAPALPPAAVALVAERLAATRGSGLPSIALPRAMPVAENSNFKPTPRLRLKLAQVLRDVPVAMPARNSFYRSAFGWGATFVTLAVAELSFAYGPYRFELGDPKRETTRFEDGRLLRIARSGAAEVALVRRLAATGLLALSSLESLRPREEQAAAFSLAADSAPEDFIGFLIEHRAALEAEGWTVEIDPAFSVNLASVDAGDWTFEVEPAGAEGSGVDWFDVKLGARIDGAEIDILPALTALLRGLPAGADGETLRERIADPRLPGRMLLTLPDGRIAPLPAERVLPILEALLAIWGPDESQDGKIRLPVHAAAEISQIQAGAGVVWSGGVRLLDLARELEGWRSREPTPLPAAFGAKLRPYQQTGLDWLQMLGRTGFGGLLADDMGLGKTVQTLAHLAVEKEAGRLQAPALIVAPTSVLANWAAEAERFAPMLKPLVLRGPARAQAFPRIGESDLVITSYPLLVRDKDVLLARSYAVVVFDEAQTIRNPVTAVARAACAVTADQRLGLSGTPVENHLGDLWSLMHALNPGLLGDSKSFVRAFRTPIEKRNDAAARVRLARRVQPFLLRRTKDEAAPDLPPKVEIEERVELTSGQAELYEATRIAMQTRVRQALASKGLARSSIVVLDALLKLRQVCCDPRLVKSAKSKNAGSAKLERLMELVEQLRSEGRRALIFSQFTSMLALIAAELASRGLSYAWLTGDTDDRKTPVAEFQSGAVDLFLISLKAGGTGLNLTAADAVILYDPWWNPAVEAQAIDRTHRIGRSGTVFVHRLIVEGGVEEKMLAMQGKKRALAAALWEGEEGGLSKMTEADVHALFA